MSNKDATRAKMSNSVKKTWIHHLHIATIILFAMGVTLSCSKETPDVQLQNTINGSKQNSPKSGLYALLQVTNYQGLGYTAEELGFKVYTHGAEECPYGCVQNPPIAQPPIYGFTQTNSAIMVNGYCDPTNGECYLLKGTSSTTYGPKYVIVPNKPITPPFPNTALVLEIKGVYVPMGSIGSYFSYNISNDTWTADAQANIYFQYSFKRLRIYCPY